MVAVNRAIPLLGQAGLAVGADPVRLARVLSRPHRTEPTPTPGTHANHLLTPAGIARGVPALGPFVCGRGPSRTQPTGVIDPEHAVITCARPST